MSGINAIAVYPILVKERKGQKDKSVLLEEITALIKAIDVEVADALLVNVYDVNPATYIGKGAVEKVAQAVRDRGAEVAVFDVKISPIQQRNLEKELNVKVIDRTALILEIFAKRARTKEGVLQVELARLTYQRSRLVKAWSHLERQRGGKGFLGGPGERQLELDKRMMSGRISKIKKDLEQVKKTRSLHRISRQKVPYKIVALVGYTNAGKSTLFNLLTRASVLAKDQLFATLDPTMRKMMLPSMRSVILSDTVGFIADIPTELIEAFSATLEEVAVADIILHVRDISHPDTEKQKEEVMKTLKGIVSEDIFYKKTIEVLNKVDLLDDDDKITLLNRKGIVAVSAKKGTGMDNLLKNIDDLL